jgi:hypothetical protein
LDDALARDFAIPSTRILITCSGILFSRVLMSARENFPGDSCFSLIQPSFGEGFLKLPISMVFERPSHKSDTRFEIGTQTAEPNNRSKERRSRPSQTAERSVDAAALALFIAFRCKFLITAIVNSFAH